jgi:hypothetical protein
VSSRLGRGAHLLRPPRAQALDVFQFQPQHLLVKEKNRIKSLILRAGRHIISGKSREKPLELLFAGQGRRQRFNEGAITFEPAAVTVFCAQRKMLPPDDIGQLLNSLGGDHDLIIS